MLSRRVMLSKSSGENKCKPRLLVFQKAEKCGKSSVNTGLSARWKKVWKVWITPCKSYVAQNYVNEM